MGRLPKHGHLLEYLGYSPGAKDDNEEEATDLPFDLADAMELGFASRVTTQYEAAPGAGAAKMSVAVAEDGQEFRLFDRRGRNTLLLARASGNHEATFDIFLGSEEEAFCRHKANPQLGKHGGPAFTLRHERSKARWVLTSPSCPCCEYRSSRPAVALAARARGAITGPQRTLAVISQERVAVGEGRVMALTVELPDDGFAWCSRCGGDGPFAPATPAAVSKSSQRGGAPPRRLTSRRPKWDKRIGSLTLDFRGRCTQASERNFQIVQATKREGRPESCLLQFGKMDSDRFCLDFRSPFGIVQAFATAVTTANWA